jgi:hypothetical protein
VVQREVQDPAEYAELWIRDGGRPDDATYPHLYRAWLEDFVARGVEAVGFGLVALRRPEVGRPPRMRRVEEARRGVQRPLGAHLAACLEAMDRVGRSDGRRAAGGPCDGCPGRGPAAAGRRVRAGARADTALAALVGACDGELTVGQIARALAELLERPTQDVVSGQLPAVRALVADRLLTIT